MSSMGGGLMFVGSGGHHTGVGVVMSHPCVGGCCFIMVSSWCIIVLCSPWHLGVRRGWRMVLDTYLNILNSGDTLSPSR